MSLSDNTDLERSLTVKEFCALERMSPSAYYKMRREGHGPAELHIPGIELTTITATARREWHERMVELGQTTS
jgi:hypothetical protein